MVNYKFLVMVLLFLFGSCQKAALDHVSTTPYQPPQPSAVLYYNGESFALTRSLSCYYSAQLFSLTGATSDDSLAFSLSLSNQGELGADDYGYGIDQFIININGVKEYKVYATGVIWFTTIGPLGVIGTKYCSGMFSTGDYDYTAKTWSIGGTFENIAFN
jgi:hypothetical protein